jgi:glycosyltransferase involved in cell wall biosynthesis/SAM-dependent methyltransferase
VNVLFISLDKNLLQPKSGDSRVRHLRYAQDLSHLAVIVLSTKRDGLKEKFARRNFIVRATNSLSRWTYITDALRIAHELNKWQKVDIVSAQDPFICALIALLLKAMWGVPVNIQVHNDYFQSEAWRNESFQNRMFFHIGKLTLNRAQSIRVVSERIDRSIRTFINPRIPIRKILVSPSTGYQTGKTAKKNIDIVSVGRLVDQKDFPTLIRAVANLKDRFPNIKTVVIGSGPTHNEIARQLKSLGLTKNVRLTGEYSRQRVIRTLSRAKIYVSSSKYEGSSIALLEAMSMGLPVIATKVSGSEEIIRSGMNGFLIEPGDASTLAKHIRELLENEPLRASIGSKAKKTANEIIRTNPHKKWTEFLIKTSNPDLPTNMKQANISHYDADSGELDKSRTDASKLVYYPKIVSWLKQYVRKDQTVMDIGGGSGVVLARLRSELGSLAVVGLDISMLMLKHRKTLGLRENIVGDMDELPFQSGSADTIVFIASLHHTLRIDKAIRESFRVLKSHGTLLLIEHNSFRYLFYPKRNSAIPAPRDPRECLINHRVVRKQLIENGFIIRHISLHRQLVTLVQIFIKDIPLPLYRVLTAMDEATGWIPGYKEFGSLMLIAARKR